MSVLRQPFGSFQTQHEPSRRRSRASEASTQAATSPHTVRRGTRRCNICGQHCLASKSKARRQDPAHCADIKRDGVSGVAQSEDTQT